MEKKIKAKVSKPKVTLISYAIKMTIPTGQYANIQPEIIVKADSVESAEKYIIPHMNKLWKEYYMISERPVAKPVAPAKTEPLPPASSVAFEKAKSAVDSAMSVDALKLIQTQILNSVKLDPKDKDVLNVMVLNRIKVFNSNAGK
jgi:hypothetical protein